MEAQILQFVDFTRVPFALGVIVVAWLLNRFMARSLDDLGVRFTERRLLFKQLGSFSRFLILLVTGVLVVAAVVRFSNEVLITIGGSVAVAVGFAFKDLLASLIDALGLDLDDAPVTLRTLSLRQDPGLGVDRVAVEGRLRMAQRLDLEVGDGRARDIGHAHAEHQRVDEIADHDVLAVDRLVLGEPLVGVERVVIHRDHAEEMIVGLGDGLARPVSVDVAGLEVFEIPAEWSIVGSHDGDRRFTRP